MNMNFDEFTELAEPVHAKPDNRLYWAVALGGEVGELLNIEKKIERDGYTQQHRDEILDESGDVLFYLTHNLMQHGWTLQEAAEHLIQKLERKREEKA